MCTVPSLKLVPVLWDIVRKIPANSVIVLLSIIMMVGLLNILSPNNVLAQTLHNRTLYEGGKQTSELDQTSGVRVGNGLADMVLSYRYDEETDKEEGILYVSNFESDSVSVISAENNTVIEEIPVEDAPEAIDVVYGFDPESEEYRERVYVAHGESNSVSVISIYENNSKTVENIPVDVLLVGVQIPIAFGYLTDTVTDQEIGIVYIIGSDSISLISEENNTVIEEISLERQPGALAPSNLEDKVYVANSFSDSISAISISLNNTEVNTAIEEIDVEPGPTAIAIGSGIDPVTNEGIERVYVAHGMDKNSKNVSMISIYENNSKTVENIPVGGGPTAIAIGSGIDPVTNEGIERVYVANTGSDSVSVISIYENNSKTVENIPVGGGPTAIAISSHVEETEEETEEETDMGLDTVYVANTGSDSVSVISAENNKVIANIPVEDVPEAISTADDLDTVYVANTGSDSVSVIDDSAKKAVEGVTFKVNPISSGYILCDGVNNPSPIGQYTYVYSGTGCIARPNEGFEFSSWVENLEGNSTQPLRVSRPASGWDSFVLAITDFFGDKPVNPESKLNITKFGTFTANFVTPVQFTIPWEFVAGLILGPIAGWSIPGIIGLVKSKRDVRKLNYYHKEIASLYEDGKLDEKDIEALGGLEERVEDAYSQGKISDKHYESLRNEISTLYEKIFRERINGSSNNNSSATKRHTQEQLAQIRNDVEYAYSEGKITDKHFNLLDKAISNLEGKGREDTS